MFHVALGLDDDSSNSGGYYLRYHIASGSKTEAYVEFVILWIRIEFKTWNNALQVRTRFGDSPWTSWKSLI